MTPYPEAFRAFVMGRLSQFWLDLAPFYKARGGNPDSLSYFNAHLPRFQAMVDLCRQHGIEGSGLASACELGSWYPYTTYAFRGDNPSLPIDLYDIIPRVLGILPYSVDGITLIDHNLCTEELPPTEYDLVILSEVMEHLPIDLFAFERRVIDVVSPGGHLVVTHPLGGNNAQDYGTTYEDRDMHSLQEDHVREFTAETVPLFFRGMTLVGEVDVEYPAYGLIRVRLYRRGERDK